MKLSDISEIFVGVLKSRFSTETKEAFNYLGIDYLSLENGIVNCQKAIPLNSSKEIDKRFFIKSGDIVVKLFPPINYFEVKNVEANLLPLANVAVIRILDKSITATQLIYILKCKRQELEKIANGSHQNIKVLKVTDLKQIDISEFLNDSLLDTKSKIDLLLEKEKILLERKKELITLKQKCIQGGKYE